MINLFLFLCLQINDSLSILQLKNHIQFLASDSLQGRAVGTIFEKQARDYIQNQLITQKLTTTIDSFQVFGNDTLTSYNVIAETGNFYRKKIFITAHYDHLGLGNEKSKEIKKGKIHNGADDNASGVALMLEIAREWQLYKPKVDFDLIFIAFSGHELGLFGSKNFENKYFPTLDTIKYAINLDMVGRMDSSTNQLILRYFYNENELANWDKIINTDLKILKSKLEQELDNSIFFRNNVSTCTLSTGIHTDYHRSTDDFEKINFNGIVKIKKIIFNFLKHTNL